MLVDEYADDACCPLDMLGCVLVIILGQSERGAKEDR